MEQFKKEQAIKLLEVVDAGLVAGIGKPVPGQMCIMAAYAFALGRPHGDNQVSDCVHPVVRAFDIGLNDAAWSSPAARAKGTRREAICKFGSAHIDGHEFVRRLAEQTIKQIAPIALRAAADLHKIKQHQKALRAAADRCEQEGTESAASDASDAASDASAASAASFAGYAARAASFAGYAASDAARAARAASDAARAARGESDCILSKMADIAADILIELGTQGSQWLDIL